MKTFAKHLRQLKRKPENVSKSIKLAIKQSCNESIKKRKKDKSLSDSLRTALIASDIRIKNEFKV